MAGELQSKGVEALSEIANVLEKVVVGDQRGNSGEKSGSSGDQRFRNTGGDGAKAGRASGAETGESVDDAPDRAEQADKRGNASRRGQPGHTFLYSADFVGGRQLHSNGDGLKRFDPGMRVVAFTCHLGLEFAIAGSVDVSKRRAGSDDALRIGNTFRGAEDSQELVGLATNAAEDAHLLEDQRPRNEREEEKKQEDSAGHQASLLEDVENVADDNGG